MATTATEPRVLIDDTVAKLEELIVRGELLPGRTLLPEQALADTLGVSRGPLREAIRTLEGRRLIERTPHAGVRVVKLSLEDLEQLLVTREALEGMACRQAAENMTAAEIRQLRETAARIEQMLKEAPVLSSPVVPTTISIGRSLWGAAIAGLPGCFARICTLAATLSATCGLPPCVQDRCHEPRAPCHHRLHPCAGCRCGGNRDATARAQWP